MSKFSEAHHDIQHLWSFSVFNETSNVGLTSVTCHACFTDVNDIGDPRFTTTPLGRASPPYLTAVKVTQWCKYHRSVDVSRSPNW